MLSSYDTIGNRGTRAKPQTDENQARQPLGHLSPNVGLKSTKSYKLQSGSPLKRPLAAALDAQNGFTYLKRRKLSSSTTPQPTVNLELQNDETASNNLATFRFAASAPEHLPPLVSSQVAEEQRSEKEQSWDRSSSSERHSFSSLINYDPSSQPGHTLSQHAKRLVHEPPRRATASMVLGSASRAEALRLKLRVAMYKVQTNQVDIPFDYLREQTDHGMRESSRAVKEAVEQLRLEATSRLATRRSSFKPDAATAEEDSIIAAMIDLPSTNAHDNVQSDLHMHTPRSRMGRIQASDLTSSAVKSNVAEGLLGLKNSS